MMIGTEVKMGLDGTISNGQEKRQRVKSQYQ
jgi:hypothetical protein